MRLDLRNRHSDLAACRGDQPGWLLQNKERGIIRQYLLSAELAKQCLGVNRARVDAALSRLAAKHIDIPRPSVVRAYLMDHLDILQTIIRVCESVAAGIVVEGTQLLLTVYTDPEINDRYLSLYIRQRDYPDDFLATLHGIYANYASDLIDKSGWFQVTTDFAPPAE